MIVVDSSVLIFAIRGVLRPSTEQLRYEVAHRRLLIGDISLLEVLRGAQNEAHAARLETQLRRYEIVPMLDETIALAAARNYRSLRARGITIAKLADLIIATFCIEKDHQLLQDDRDFLAIAQHLGLRLARPRSRTANDPY